MAFGYFCGVHTQNTCFFLNGDFDITLGSPSSSHGYLVAEMTAWFVPLSRPGDRVVLDVSIPEAYREYLFAKGIDVGDVSHPQDSVPCQGRAWGWNDRAIARLEEQGARCIAPPLAVVRRCNSRSLSDDLARTHQLGVPFSKRCADLDAIESHLMSHKEIDHWVLKPEFGNAGIGFMKLNREELRTKRHAIISKLSEPGTARYLEPWLERELDLSTRLVLSPSGTIEQIDHYQTLTSSSGAFFGLLLDPRNQTIRPWVDALRETADIVAEALHKEGYFGPASFDALVTRGIDGSPRLIPLLEINARESMSTIALAVTDRLGHHGPALLRTISSQRFRLPPTYEQLRTTCGSDLFDAMVWLTPLAVQDCSGQSHTPHRSIFLITADSVSDLHEKHASFLQSIRT